MKQSSSQSRPRSGGAETSLETPVLRNPDRREHDLGFWSFNLVMLRETWSALPEILVIVAAAAAIILIDVALR